MFKKAGKRQVGQDSGTLFPTQELCTSLLVPEVNPELWDKSIRCGEGSRTFRSLALQTCTLVRAKSSASGSIPIADVYASTIDVVTLLGNAIYELSMKRRELLKPEIAAGFKFLCRDNQSLTTRLVGDELSQNIRNIAQIKRMFVRKGPTKRKLESSTSSSIKLARSASYRSEPSNFKRRSDPYRPWRNQR